MYKKNKDIPHVDDYNSEYYFPCQTLHTNLPTHTHTNTACPTLTWNWKFL